jgi:hypothetical protein
MISNKKELKNNYHVFQHDLTAVNNSLLQEKDSDKQSKLLQKQAFLQGQIKGYEDCFEFLWVDC